MKYREMGRSGLRVSEYALGTMTFGGSDGWFGTVGRTQIDEARDIVACAIDNGINLFDTADVYSNGASEEILGQALKSRREDVLVLTKAHGQMGAGPNERGSSRHHLLRACENSLRRLGRNHIDIFMLHGVDEIVAVEETLKALDDLVRSGKVRYIGCSNYSGWHLMKALATSDRLGVERFSCQQVYYSLIARELENELLPAAIDQGVGSLIWSPLSMGWLTGKFKRGAKQPSDSRQKEVGYVDAERAYDIVDVLAEVAEKHQATIAQIALAWVASRRGVSSVVFGARSMEQLQQNLGAVGVSLDAADVEKLNAVSEANRPFPYWHQRQYNASNMKYVL